jgi:hypothetical protein
MSYNCARAQKADIGVLSKFRKVMLGESAIPDRIRCWLHLVAATCYDPKAGTARPAHRDEQGHPNVEEPRWFRIGQFRIPSYPALFLVQRTVLINSFAFTLLIARTDAEWPSPEFDQWSKVFAGIYPEAMLILPGGGSLTMIAGRDHAAASMEFLFSNHPGRFSDDANPFIAHTLKSVTAKDGAQLVTLHVPHELIRMEDITTIASTLHMMVSTRENAAAFRQRVGVMVSGFDDDPRELWQVPEVKQFFRRLFFACPFVMLVAHPDGGLLKLFAACWLYEDERTEEIQQQRMSEFLCLAFHGLNSLNHTLALGEEQNREICMSAAKVLFGETPPG